MKALDTWTGGVLTIGVALAIFGCGASPAAGAPRSPAAMASTAAGSPSPQSCPTQTQPPGTPGTFTESNGGTEFSLAFSGCTWSVTASNQVGAPITGTWTYSAATGQVSFTETAGLCGPVTGVYSWNLTGSSLKMAAVSDSCAARSQQFAGYVWTRDQ